MSDAHKDQKKTSHKLVTVLSHAAHSVKKSPSLLRKKFGKKMGKNSQYSELNGSLENGWLHADEQVMVGVSYKLKYLASVEIQYRPKDPEQNNKWAIECMRQMKDYTKGKGESHDFNIAVGHVTLTSLDHHEIVMRHSTSRIAYSTVDHKDQRLFCYVALPRKEAMPLCHVFYTKSPRQSYELTFTCAQAFDANYQNWTKNKSVATLKASASEAGDVEPSAAHRSPRPIRKVLGVTAEPARAPSPLTRQPDASEEDKKPEEPKPLKDVPIIPTSMLEIEEGDADGMGEVWGSLVSAKSVPDMLEIGVEPEDFNKSFHADDLEDNEETE